MPQLAIRLLGPFQVTLDSQPITGFAYDKVRALLAYLAVEADHFHRRDTLATLLWPDHPPKLARQNLRQSLTTLRRAIKDKNALPPFLLIDGDTVQFNYSSHTWLDVAVFRAYLNTDDHHHLNSEIETCQSCIQHMAEAVALYRGEFLVDLLLGDCSEFETWAITCREQLHLQVLTALHHLTRHYLRRGQYSQAQTYALHQIELAPYREEAHRQLMRILACTGQRSAALIQYETCCRILAEEFDVEPSEQTQILYKRIRSAGKRCPHNLPPQLTSLIGREGDLQQLAEHLANPGCRLLTLTGPGGIGKTRLALQAATEHVGIFLHGVYFVPLAALSSATFLVSAIADALDLRFSGSQDPETELLDYLHEQEMLLVFDNFEHLLSSPEGGIEGGTKLLLDILKHAPEVKMMVTSRTRLNLQAEWVFKVRELAFPEKVDAEGAETYSAVRLFFERARRVETSFLLSAATIPAVVRICQLVEGMPLGIELAAAFVLALSCDQIATEIERDLDVLATSMQDVPERHRSLRAVLKHSWDLLSTAEQAVIRKSAVFQGSFEPEAARAVTGATLPQLGTLVDKSFLNQGQTGQYDIHPLLKQYEKLAVDPQEQAETEARHGAYYADFMAAMLEKRKQAEQHQDIQAAVKAASGNVVAALQWAAARREPAALNNIIYLLYLYYDASGQYETGKKVFDQALGLMEKYTNPSDEECLVLAKVLGFVSVYNLRLAAYHQARERLQQSLAIARQLKHQAHISFCLHALSEVALGLGDYAETRRLAEEALAVRRQTGGSPVTILNFLGKVALEEGKLTEAKEYQAEALAIARANKQVVSGNVAHPLEGLGLVAHRMGEPLAAREYLQESLEICRAIDHKWGIA
ncbi:BTAD domain-containing putative transcriptional regulator, partial [Chloroflexota bacterium]